LGRIARRLRVKVRTLLNWRKAAGRPLKRQGRPPATRAQRREVKALVAWLIKKQGWMGWRILALSFPDVPTRLLQWALADLKARKRRQERKERENNRVHYHYTTQGVIGAQDTAHVAQWKRGRIFAELLVDPATTCGEGTGNGSKPTADSVVGYLSHLEEEDRLFLVHQTDNDPAQCSFKAEQWRKAHKVIHLRSRPHTPQDNPAVESFIGEVKHSYFTLGRENICQSPAEGVSDASQIADRLNTYRKRLFKGGKTADQLTAEMPGWNISVTREVFYQAACEAIENATRGLKGREARTAERQAIFQTLERFGFLIRSRGEGAVS
jgi:transposase InsO family protein